MGFQPITRSIVQGSGLGPMLFIALAKKLKTLSKNNSLSKYADDTSLLVPQNSDTSIETEFQHVLNWSRDAKLILNANKTKEIIFWRTGQQMKKHKIPLMDGIERVEKVVLLGVVLTSQLSWTMHVDFILSIVSQRFYLLNKLKHMSLIQASLTNLFQALVISRVLYALPAFSGSLKQSDRDRLDAMFRKAKRWGLTSLLFDFSVISATADSKLFFNIVSNNKHCLPQFLPSKKEPSKYNLRKSKLFSLTLIHDCKFTCSFIYRCCSTQAALY